MSDDPRDKAAALAEGMEAAGALIESLEQEVADLRSDLEEASAALKAAQEEVSSRAADLEEKERASAEAQREVEDLRAEISSLKQRHSDEQLRLSNEHISELAEVRETLEDASFVPESRSQEEVVILPFNQLLGRPFGALVLPGRTLVAEATA